MYFDATWLTLLLIFVGFYYLFLFFIALSVKDEGKEPDKSYFYFLIIPARNEEKVIENTINGCLKIKGDNFRTIVVNDNSTDSTPKIVDRLSKQNEKVILLDNPPQHAYKGKGAVLNYAFEQINLAINYNFTNPLNLSPDFLEKFDESHIIIGVFDADAIPNEDILEVVSSIFSAKELDAVQTAVRISNKNQSMLAKMQDIEFLGFSRIIQKARSKFGSVGLGGNGQFTKLSSLKKIRGKPWGDTLTEDFELGLRFISHGMRLGFTDKVIVEQEGVVSLIALLKQRTRWLQGHFINWKYIPSIIKSHSSILTKIDTLIYIVFVSVVFLVGLSLAVSLLSIAKYLYVSNQMLEIFYNKSYLLGIFALLCYSFAFIPLFIYSVFKFYREQGLLKKLLYIFLFAIYTYIWLPAGIAALYRIILKKSEWLPTKRVAIERGIGNYVLQENNMVFQERRRLPRLAFRAFALIQHSPCFIVDINELGAGVIMPKTSHISDRYVELDIPVFGNKKGNIVWKKEMGDLVRAGVEFAPSS